MRIALICIDSRGGTQPYLALGIGLKAAGHDVLVIAPENFEALVTRAGLAFLGVRGDLMALLLDPKQAGVAEGGFWRSHVFAMKLLRSFLDEWMPVCHEACDGYEVLLGGFGGSLVGESVGEKLGIPFVQAHVQPWSPTRAFAGLLFDPLPSLQTTDTVCGGYEPRRLIPPTASMVRYLVDWSTGFKTNTIPLPLG